jgi:hypothetical protein
MVSSPADRPNGGAILADLAWIGKELHLITPGDSRANQAGCDPKLLSQDAEKPVFAQAAQKGPDARRRAGYPSAGWVQVRGMLRPYAAAPRKRANAADGPFSAAC